MVYSINHNTERNADRNTEELKNLKPNSTQLVQLITWSIRWATVFRCSVVFKYCSIIVYQQSICYPICIQSQQQCCGMVRMCWYSTECRGRDTSIRLPVFKYKFNRLSAPVLGTPIVPLYVKRSWNTQIQCGGKYDEIQNEILGVKTSSGLVHIEILVVGDWRCRIGD